MKNHALLNLKTLMMKNSIFQASQIPSKTTYKAKEKKANELNQTPSFSYTKYIIYVVYRAYDYPNGKSFE